MSDLAPALRDRRRSGGGRDQALTAKTLRLASSSFYGLQCKVRTIEQAIAVLGFDSVRALVTSAGIIGNFNSAGTGFDFTAFWRHAVGTALCAKSLARLAKCNQEFAFVSGLLHDIGRMVLVTGLPEEYGAAIAHRMANDCDNLQIGTLTERQLRPEQAAQIVIDSRGKRYDPAVVAAFEEVITGRSPVEAMRDQALPVFQLRPGMRTTRDLLTREGSLLLSAEHVLTARMIQQIGDFEKTSGMSFSVYVKLKEEAS